ncbi:hypothetical protein HN018_06765 [Lichenicola cladoniae]|uniref:Uncharacterized protein n=1 Tax=Lichenicola cladoniae TaxID=1484109 RepID=A0A6M8HN37_9PROT|nr:hypothetical protein [Lichenicola cladoniae]NPD67274.1 hypothetical protein [Acetobacteraceae bacterium]QKE89778.1 hypothetical protein HN018_06765 [Lichenicola cladoniae]
MRLAGGSRMLVCAECGLRCDGPYGFRSHWAQKHHHPGRVRAHPIPEKLFPPAAQALMDLHNEARARAIAKLQQGRR